MCTYAVKSGLFQVYSWKCSIVACKGCSVEVIYTFAGFKIQCQELLEVVLLLPWEELFFSQGKTHLGFSFISVDYVCCVIFFLNSDQVDSMEADNSTTLEAFVYSG